MGIKSKLRRFLTFTTPSTPSIGQKCQIVQERTCGGKPAAMRHHPSAPCANGEHTTTSKPGL
jgi:hypothetical protein